jgi:5-methylcytosine-specific restriction endonuclease McrA
MPTAPQSFRASKRKTERQFSRGTKQQRGYGGEWERISKLYRQSHPVCEICNAAPAVDTDHIRPFHGVSDPLRTDWSNLQAVCRPCHARKTRWQG